MKPVKADEDMETCPVLWPEMDTPIAPPLTLNSWYLMEKYYITVIEYSCFSQWQHAKCMDLEGLDEKKDYEH